MRIRVDHDLINAFVEACQNIDIPTDLAIHQQMKHTVKQAQIPTSKQKTN